MTARVVGEGPPLLLIHGTAGDGESWRQVQEALGRSRRVIAYDRRGYDRAVEAKPSRVAYAEHARDAAALLDATPAWVVGWSSGGIVALHLALREPDRVRGLVLIETPLHARRHPSLHVSAGFVRSMLWRLARDDAAAAASFLRAVSCRVDGPSDFDRLSPEAQAGLTRPASALLAELGEGTGEELDARRLRGVGCPVVFVVGAQSRGWMRAIARDVCATIPGARTVLVAGAGHFLPMADPSALVRVVEDAIALER